MSELYNSLLDAFEEIGTMENNQELIKKAKKYKALSLKEDFEYKKESLTEADDNIIETYSDKDGLTFRVYYRNNGTVLFDCIDKDGNVKIGKQVDNATHFDSWMSGLNEALTEAADELMYDKNLLDKYNPVIDIKDRKRYQVRKCDGKKFAYDKQEALLHWIFQDDDEKKVLGKDCPWRSADAQGLSYDSWKENPDYWCDYYVSEIEEETAYMMDDIKDEFDIADDKAIEQPKEEVPNFDKVDGEHEDPDFGFVNGQLSSFDPSSLINRVVERREALHTVRLHNGICYTIFITGHYPNEGHLNIDIVTEDRSGKQERITNYDDWSDFTPEQAIEKLNAWKTSIVGKNESLTEDIDNGLFSKEYWFAIDRTAYDYTLTDESILSKVDEIMQNIMKDPGSNIKSYSKEIRNNGTRLSILVTFSIQNTLKRVDDRLSNITFLLKKRIGEALKEDKLIEMAMDRNQAIDRCYSLGLKFLEHFDKIYNENNEDTIKHHAQEMQSWYNAVKDIKLKQTNKPLRKQELIDWFFTATGDSADHLTNNDTEVEVYDDFVLDLLNKGSVQDSLRSIGLLNESLTESEETSKYSFNQACKDNHASQRHPYYDEFKKAYEYGKKRDYKGMDQLRIDLATNYYAPHMVKVLADEFYKQGGWEHKNESLNESAETVYYLPKDAKHYISHWDGDTMSYDVFDSEEEMNKEKERLAKIDKEYEDTMNDYRASLKESDLAGEKTKLHREYMKDLYVARNYKDIDLKAHLKNKLSDYIHYNCSEENKEELMKYLDKLINKGMDESVALKEFKSDSDNKQECIDAFLNKFGDKLNADEDLGEIIFEYNGKNYKMYFEQSWSDEHALTVTLTDDDEDIELGSTDIYSPDNMADDDILADLGLNINEALTEEEEYAIKPNYRHKGATKAEVEKRAKEMNISYDKALDYYKWLLAPESNYERILDRIDIKDESLDENKQANVAKKAVQPKRKLKIKINKLDHDPKTGAVLVPNNGFWKQWMEEDWDYE